MKSSAAPVIVIFLIIIIVFVLFTGMNVESFQNPWGCGCPCRRRMQMMQMHPIQHYPECPMSYAKQNCGWGHRGAWWRDF